ncbi:unnamed protein product [Closterium sp. NIES-53]
MALSARPPQPPPPFTHHTPNPTHSVSPARDRRRVTQTTPPPTPTRTSPPHGSSHSPQPPHHPLTPTTDSPSPPLSVHHCCRRLVVWCGGMRCGVEECGVVWCGVVWSVLRVIYELTPTTDSPSPPLSVHHRCRSSCSRPRDRHSATWSLLIGRSHGNELPSAGYMHVVGEGRWGEEGWRPPYLRE